MSLSQRLQLEDGAAPTPTPVSHLVFSQPGESFLGVEASAGRFPVANIRFVDDVIAWSRADGAPEFLDLRGCQSLKALKNAFESDDGLMLLSYPSLASVSDDSAPADVAFLTRRPVPARRAEVARA